MYIYDGRVYSYYLHLLHLYLNVRYALMRQCWHHLPDDRPSFTELTLLLKEYWDEEHLYIVQTL